MAVEPENVENEMTIYFKELEKILSINLSEEEVFYFASIIHLRFVHIHPFRDGNGRASRICSLNQIL